MCDVKPGHCLGFALFRYHRQPRRSLTEKGIIVWAAEVERRQIDLRPVIQGHFYDCAVQR